MLDVTGKDWQSVYLSKYSELLDYFGKICRGTDDVNDAFKLLPRQLNYEQCYS